MGTSSTKTGLNLRLELFHPDPLPLWQLLKVLDC